MLIKHHQYFTYITTNSTKKVLYTGVSNNLPQRIAEHYLNRGNDSTFAGRYHCFNLIYCKSFKYVEDAIAWEKIINGWSRKKKEELINSENAEWRFLNEDIMEWPPNENVMKREEN